MEQPNYGTPVPPAQRPTFLTVLCILSWIAQGIAAVILLLAIGGMGAMEVGASASGADTAGTGMFWAWLCIGLLCVIISFIGVLQMWKLKKAGFYMYVGAFAITTIMDGMYQGVSTLGIVVGAAFIAMYAVNLKHMR